MLNSQKKKKKKKNGPKDGNIPKTRGLEQVDSQVGPYIL
jgi:hypothetical protein